MRISDWSSDVCSSDLRQGPQGSEGPPRRGDRRLRGRADADLPPPAEARVHQHLPQAVRRAEPRPPAGGGRGQIGRASCRERVWQYVSNSVVAVSLKKKTHNTTLILKYKQK